MDPEQTFIRVQERFSQMLTPKVRVALEYLYLFIAITLFCILVVMHANYVQQPGCSSELSGVVTSEAQLIQIKITSAGLWSHNDSESNRIDPPETEIVKDKMEISDVSGDKLPFLASKLWWNWIGSGARRGKLVFKFWKTDTEFLEHQAETSTSNQNTRPVGEDAVIKIDKEDPPKSFTLSAKETLKAAIIHFGKKWYRRISFIWRHTMQIIGSFQKLWNIAGVHLNLDIPKWMHILRLDRLNTNAVQWLNKKGKLFEPTYLYTMEKGYFLLPESAKSHHNIRTVNVSISAWHSCFGNRWQQLLINRFVGYDTILINSLLSSPGQGYLYNYQTKEFYNLSYAQEVPEGPARFGDYLVTKCGVLMMSLFVFFTTTMSVSFTLRETQTRMLKFTVQLQHHARHRLPTFQLIFVHVIESLVFVPIMIGILFFLFEFYDDQLLAFMCPNTNINEVLSSLLFAVFPGLPHIFLLLCLRFFVFGSFYNRGFYATPYPVLLESVPALQRYMQNRRSQLQQHPDFHITSSTILASTLHITRLNTRNQGLNNVDLATGAGLRPGFDQSMPQNGPGVADPQDRSENNRDRVANPAQIPGQADIRQAERGPNPGSMNSFSSLLLWILGGASSEGLNSFFSMFRDVREQGQVFNETPGAGAGAGDESRENQDNIDR
ncbi:Membralin-like protein [Glycine soja]